MGDNEDMTSTKARRPTMRDVAALAGVSTQTVSNLVNSRPHLMTPETGERVAAAMQQLGYHRNSAARGLRSARTRTLAFLMLDQDARFLADPMTDLILAGIGDVVRDRGYALLIQAGRPDAPSDALLQPLLEHRADGAFLFLSGAPELRRWYLKRATEIGIRAVVFEEVFDAPSVLSVTAANRDGARRLAEHLLGRGHRRIAFVAAEVPWPMVEQRRLGYHDALSAAGISIDPQLERFAGTWGTAGGAELVDLLLGTPEPPTAIMCCNDLLALGVLAHLRQRRLRVPRDIAVTGFNDFEFAPYVDPPLTTVRTPGYEMGREAARNLIDSLDGTGPVASHVEFPVELVLRKTA
jgi:DNA-binding LacI/PurR family transcriptional regulator